MSTTTNASGSIIRSYKVIAHGPSRGRQVLSSDGSTVLYTLECREFTTKKNKYSQRLHEGDSTSGPVIGASRLSWVSTAIKVAFGDPEGPDVLWEKLSQKVLFSYNQYKFQVALPQGGSKKLEWKGTTNVGEHASTGQKPGGGLNPIALHWKLVDSENGEVLARFVHSVADAEPEASQKKGTFEILKDLGGEQWDRIVLMSNLALQEFMRKGTGS